MKIGHQVEDYTREFASEYIVDRTTSRLSNDVYIAVSRVNTYYWDTIFQVTEDMDVIRG